jgi:hypothetical protein
MSSTQRNSATTGWPKGQTPTQYSGKYLTSNSILSVTVNRTINLY